MTDIHTHILPGIDDGSQNIETSVQMLAFAKEQGIDTIVATPHFNIEYESIEHFENKRARASEALKNAVKGTELEKIKLLLGAEVALTPGLSGKESFKRLCIEGTNCILIELPMGDWTSWVYNEVYAVTAMSCIPILAHIERYTEIKANIKKINIFEEMDLCFQINSGSFFKLKYRKIINSLIKSGKTIVLGSDTHNMTTRKNDMGVAVSKIEKKYGRHIFENFEKNAAMIIDGSFGT